MRNFLAFLMIVSLSTFGSGIASASAILYDRGLPTANLNNAAGSDRSNVAWGFGADADGHWLAGDDFTLGGSRDYLVDTIRIWTTSVNTSVWFGQAGGSFNQYSPSASSVTYSDTTTYQGSGGGFLELYQLDITLNMILSGADTYQFFLDGPVPAFIHSSNAGLSGSIQQGANDLYLYGFVPNGGTLGGVGAWSSLGNGWDKASDANVQVFGNAIPEPATILLFGLGFLGVVGMNRRKQ